jgi:predicted nucleotidyltransferase
MPIGNGLARRIPTNSNRLIVEFRFVRIARCRAEPDRPSLLPLLRSETQADVLERLLLHPDDSYTVGDLAEALDVTDMSVRRELSRMVDAGILERQMVGRQGLYRASLASPLFEPLRELIERSVGVEPLLRDALADIPGIDAAVIFGSWARGQVDAESDVDVLVVGTFDYADVTARLHALQERTGREINMVAMRPKELREQRGNTKSGFLTGVLRGPMRPLVGDLDTA